MASAPKKIAIIIGSTRVNRVGPAIVDFVHKILKTSPASVEFSILDIATFNLPVFDETAMPAMVPAYAQHTKDHSKAWSAAIAKFDAYVWVVAEYNFGLPGATKNAIDYLYNEWIGKPALVISYGIQGGKTANAHLAGTLTGMKLRVAETKPQLTFKGEGMTEVMISANQGKIGPLTLEDWEKTAPEGLLKGFGELIELLDAPVSEPVKAA